MSVVEAFANIRQHLEADAESVKARLEQDLPAVAKFLGDAAQNPVLVALAKAENLGALPEGLTLVANFIEGLEASIVAAKAQGATPVVPSAS